MTPYAITPREVFHDRDLSANAKALCGLISTYETVENRRWIMLKQAELAEILGLTRETVNRLVKQIVARGHLETRNVTTTARGRVCLQYRVRHDLAEDADVVIQALGASQKTSNKTADVTLASHEEPDVSQRSHRTVKSWADVTPASHHIGPDVIPASLPQERTKPSTIRAKTNQNTLPLSAPKELDPRFAAFEDLWQFWRERDLIRRSRKAPSLESFRAAVKAGADPDRIIAGARAYLANPDKHKERGQFMLGLPKWIADAEYDDWADEFDGELRRRAALYECDGYWQSDWGPKPSATRAAA